MEVKQVLLVCFMGFASSLFAQEKEQPPSPVTTETQQDTSQIGYRKPRLELPDVIIYGKDMVILKRKRPIYESQIEFETRDAKTRLTGRRIGMRIPKFFASREKIPRLTLLRAQYGSYNSHLIEFLNSSKIGDLDYSIKLSHLEKGRWTDNSQSDLLESDLRVDWSIRRAYLTSTTKYKNHKFGYYGESNQDRGIFTQYFLRQQLFLPYLEAMMSVSEHQLNSSPKDRSDNRETTIKLSGKGQHLIESIPLRSQIDYIHVGGNGFLDVVHLSFYSFFSPYEWLNESFGLEYTSANHLKRLSPFVKINLNLGTGFFFYYRSFIEPHTMTEHVHRNPYIRNPSPIAEEHLNSVTLGAYHILENGIRTQLTIGYENSKNKPFWRYDNQWFLHTMDTRRTSLNLDFAGPALAFLNTDLSFRYLHHSPSVPYTPSIIAEAKVEYHTKFGIAIKGIGTYVGKRNTPDPQLPAYTKFDLNLRKDMLTDFEIFGGIKNLFNTKYEILVEYPEAGREVYLGAKLLF